MSQRSWQKTNCIFKIEIHLAVFDLPVTVDDSGLLQVLTGIVFSLWNVVDLH